MQRKQTSRVRRGLLYICAVFVMLSLGGTPSLSPAGSKASHRLTIYTVNYPLMYFAERIAGEHADVVFPVPADEDPAYWMPDAKTIAAYQKADLILLNGADYALWVKKVSLPRFRMVDTSKGFTSQLIRTTEAMTHSHGPAGKHEHKGYAFTTWIDLSLAAQQAKAVMESMSRKRPELKLTFQKNYGRLANELRFLDHEIKAIVTNNQRQPLIASHPVYQYFTRRYGLNVQSVHWEPDEEPSHGQWSELKGMLKNHPAKWMIWEGKPLEETVETLKTLGVDSMVFDPCGNVPEKGDFLSVMRENVENLRRAF